MHVIHVFTDHQEISLYNELFCVNLQTSFIFNLCGAVFCIWPRIFLHLSYYLPNLVPPMKILSQRLYFKYLSDILTVGKSVLGLYGYVNWLIWLTCCQFQRKVKWKWKDFNFWLTANAERSENLFKPNSLLVSSILENIYYGYSPVFL